MAKMWNFDTGQKDEVADLDQDLTPYMPLRYRATYKIFIDGGYRPSYAYLHAYVIERLNARLDADSKAGHPAELTDTAVWVAAMGLGMMDAMEGIKNEQSDEAECPTTD